MRITDHFNLSRFVSLLKLELFRSRKGLVITLDIAFGLCFFIGLLLSNLLEDKAIIFHHRDAYVFTLIIGGFVLSSLAFNALASPLRSIHYLSLPVSSLERFLAMWLLTSVGWVVLYTAIFSLYTIFANIVGNLLFSHINFVPFNPLDAFTFKVIHYYLILQSIFLAGAAHFRGYAFAKTLFTLLVLALLCGGLAYLIIGDVMGEEADACMGEDASALKGLPVYHVWEVLKWFFWWILAPLCWVLGYLGLKEQEA